MVIRFNWVISLLSTRPILSFSVFVFPRGNDENNFIGIRWMSIKRKLEKEREKNSTCGDISENCSHWLIVCCTVLGRIKKCDLIESDISLVLYFEIAKAHTRPISSSWFWIICNLSATTGAIWLPATMFPPWWPWTYSL